MPPGLPYLLGAIALEVVATSTLKLTDQFTRPIPTAIVLVGYGAAFYLLTLSLRFLNVGVAYAVWSGLGTVLITLVGWRVYGERLDAAAWAGIGLIVAGVVVLNAFSTTTTHG